MKKIPTLFVRDFANRATVLPVISEGCAWALTDPLARATRKYDGTCVMLDDDDRWWARREVKQDRPMPQGWWQVDHDEATDKRTGWEPIGQSAFVRWHTEAVARLDPQVPGTYELVGPKINGNPERNTQHELIRHADAVTFTLPAWNHPVPVRAAFEALRELTTSLGESGIEGIVWHHPDGRMVKLKARDFR